MRVQRRRCDKCGGWHRELPDMIVPFKRHCMETIEQIINGKEALTCTELETSKKIREWWNLMAIYILGALASIKEKYGIEVSHEPPHVNLAEIVRALANANLWPCTRSVLDAVP